jgi:hypothetical protein
MVMDTILRINSYNASIVQSCNTTIAKYGLKIKIFSSASKKHYVAFYNANIVIAKEAIVGLDLCLWSVFNFAPRGEILPPPPGVKIFCLPLRSSKHPLGVNIGVIYTPRVQSSPLEAKFPWGQTHVKNWPLCKRIN